MPSRKRSLLWGHFVKDDDVERAQCNHCHQSLSLVGGSLGNLGRHLRNKHPAVIIGDGEQTIGDEDNENVIYEYVVASSPRSSDSNDITEQERKAAQVHHRRSVLLPERKPVRQEKIRKRTLIQKLTAEKITLTNLQKELVGKELEEKNLKVMILQDEMEHKKQMHELEKREILLKIETLQAQLEKNTNKTPKLDLPLLN